MINLIAETIAVIASSWLLARKYFGISSFSGAILTCFILSFAQIVLVELLLGSAHLLYSGNVFLAHLLILILAFAIYYNKKTSPFLKPDIGVFINSNLLLLAFSVFLAFFLVKAYINLINPPVNPDSMQYHLAFPATWITNANLDNPLFIFGAGPVVNPGSLETSSLSYYPINAQLFFAWLMLPLRNAFLADVGEAPFYIIGIIALYSILRKYNVNRKIALLSGFLWALIPNIFKQLRSGSLIDVICAVLFLLLFDALLSLKSRFTFKNALLFGISVGLFVGTKIINLVWLAALSPLICYILYRAVKASRLRLSKLSCFLGIMALMIVLFGGFMYIKNYLLTGNPLFPVELKIFGKTIFRGLLDNSAYKIQIAVDDRFELMRIIFGEGLGVQFLTLILPGTILPVFFYKYLKNKVYPLGEHLLLFATPLIMFILYSIFINLYTVRYFFPYLSLGLLTSVIFITKFPRAEKYLLFISFIAILASAFELAHRHELILSLLFSALLFTALAVYKKQVAIFYKSKMFDRAILVALLLGSLFLIYFNNKYDKEEFDRYLVSSSKKEPNPQMGESLKWFNEQTKEGSRVAYTGRAEFYPLFGTKLKNEVKYISINAKEANPYNKPDGLFRRTKDFSAWQENLKKERIQYLFIMLPFFINRESDDPSKFPIEDEWAAGHTQLFKLLLKNPVVHIYSVNLMDSK